MSVPRTSASSARAPSKSIRKPQKHVMWSAIFGPPYGCPGHESVSFNEDVLGARQEAAEGMLSAVADVAIPADPVEADHG